jgi:hypothetical protein
MSTDSGHDHDLSISSTLEKSLLPQLKSFEKTGGDWGTRYIATEEALVSI